jgi:hypothetical protein
VLAGGALGEYTPPGEYSDTGRVVRTAHGHIDLFTGYGGCLVLGDELQALLAPHLGEFVRVDYTRVEDHEGMLFDPSGAPIGRIRRVTTLAKDLDALPVRIVVRPEKPRFALAEPVSVEVVLTNATAAPMSLRLDSGACHLLEDYRSVLELRAPEPVRVEQPGPPGDGAVGVAGELPSDPERRAKPESRGTVELAPGASHRVTLESAWMARPGRYRAVYVLPGPDEWSFQSRLVDVEVAPPADAAGELDALRAWLPRAAREQRVRIAERMIELGDDSGVTEIVRLLDGPEFVSFSRVYNFLWRHGGIAAEDRLLERLARAEHQAPALTLVEGIYRSPRAIPMFEALLADRRETYRSFSGWCDRPRVCDIAAAWLAGHAKELRFPVGGTVEERSEAVARVRRALREDPTSFSVFR